MGNGEVAWMVGGVWGRGQGSGDGGENLGGILYFESWFVAQCGDGVRKWLVGQGHRMSTADISRF